MVVTTGRKQGQVIAEDTCLIDAIRGIVFDAYLEVEANLILTVVVVEGKTGRGVRVEAATQAFENVVDRFQSRVDPGQVLVGTQNLLLHRGLGGRQLVAPAPIQGAIVLELPGLGLEVGELVADGDKVVQGTALAKIGGLFVQCLIQLANGALLSRQLLLQTPAFLGEPGDSVTDEMVVELLYLVQTA